MLFIELGLAVEAGKRDQRPFSLVVAIVNIRTTTAAQETER
jgi:hypothetical protein